ncbi:MAG TPA: hypothetical protein VG941_00305 [Candidatus Paceibacterota bacterium]|nr:hypothetical protein [Candidatus Paceibacterota bacterium]
MSEGDSGFGCFADLMAMYKCPNCGNEQKTAGKCQKCGADIKESDKKEEGE